VWTGFRLCKRWGISSLLKKDFAAWSDWATINVINDVALCLKYLARVCHHEGYWILFSTCSRNKNHNTSYLGGHTGHFFHEVTQLGCGDVSDEV
jgi:hypothetical protein